MSEPTEPSRPAPAAGWLLAAAVGIVVAGCTSAAGQHLLLALDLPPTGAVGRLLVPTTAGGWLFKGLLAAALAFGPALLWVRWYAAPRWVALTGRQRLFLSLFTVGVLVAVGFDPRGNSWVFPKGVRLAVTALHAAAATGLVAAAFWSALVFTLPVGWNGRRTFWLFLGVGVAARTLFPGLPPGFNQDEASIGYDTYALLHHGIDRNGQSYPVHLIAWGSGQNALYAYLSMPAVALFGPTVWAVRVANVLVGIASLVVFYRVARRLNGPTFGLVALAVLATNPWHVVMCRWGLESNLLPGVFLFAFAALVRSLSRPGWLPVAAGLAAVSLYAYGTAYFAVPVFLALALPWLLWRGGYRWWHWLAANAVFAAVAAPIVLFVLVNKFKWETVHLGPVTVPRLPGTPRFDMVSALFQDGGLVRLGDNLGRFLSLVSVHQTDGQPWSATLWAGLFYPFGPVLAAVGLVVVVRRVVCDRTDPHYLLLAWLAAGVALAGVTDVNVNRVNLALLPVVYLIAVGAYTLVGRWQQLVGPLILAFAVGFGGFVWEYATVYRREVGPAFHDGLCEAIRAAADRTDGPVAVTAPVNMPYVYALFATRADPHEFDRTVVYTDPAAPFRNVERFGRFRFGSADLANPAVGAFVVAADDADRAAGLGLKVERFAGFAVAVRPPP